MPDEMRIPPRRAGAAHVVLPPSWEAARVEDTGRNLELHRASHRELARLAREPGLVHYAGLAERPGVWLWTTQLELTYFPPRTSRNAAFRLHLVRWEEQQWTVVTIPKKSERFAGRVAHRVGLRIADGVPTLIEPEGPRFFVMNAPSVFHLEYAAGPLGEGLTNLVNSPAGREILDRAEKAEVDRIRSIWNRSHEAN